MKPETLLFILYTAAALLLFRAGRRTLPGLGGAAAAVLFLLLAFALRLDIEMIGAALLGLLSCLLLPKRRERT